MATFRDILVNLCVALKGRGMGVFDHAEFDGHESLHFINDVATRLSRGMTYKNAVAELPFGGGKAVILANDNAPKTPELLSAFGRAINSLGGHYVTAEDVGMSVDDMRHVQQQTQYVSGLPQSGDSAGGDPSPWTALGVYLGIEAAVSVKLGKDSLDGLSVAIQGVGHVGAHLCQLLHDAGAKLIVADVNRDHLNAVSKAIPVEIVAPSEILYANADVLAPCALGNILTTATIPNIKAKIIAGAANNQLSTLADGARLSAREILYAPDYVINAGGYGDSSEGQVRADVEKIPTRLQALFAEANQTGRPTNELADELACRLITAGKD